MDAYLAGADEPPVRRRKGGPGMREGVAAHVRHCREQWETSGPFRAFGVRAAPDATLAGTVGLRFAAEGLVPGRANVPYGRY